MRYFTCFILLAIGFALTTVGLMAWQRTSFSFAGLWFFNNDMQPHALHVLVLGLAMIPPSLWEIFMLENGQRLRAQKLAATPSASTAGPHGEQSADGT